MTTRPPRRRTALAAIACGFAMLATACDNAPTGPSPERYAIPRLNVLCQPSGPLVTCTATQIDVPRFGASRDVTVSATWIVSDASVARFTAPGVLTPIRHGEVEISATFQQLTASVTSSFLVDPSETARWVYWVAGSVTDAETGLALPDARVEILSGYATGAWATCNQYGFYRIDHILTVEEFSARASKPGYESRTVTYHVDPPVGPGGGNPPSINFALRRLS